MLLNWFRVGVGPVPATGHTQSIRRAVRRPPVHLVHAENLIRPGGSGYLISAGAG